MDLDTFIISVFCVVDERLKRVVEALPNGRLRQKGPSPILADSEVLTIEIVGAFLGYAQDKALFDYFKRHWSAFFPGLRKIHRTTFTRQAANLWKIKEAIWMGLIEHDLPAAPYVIADSLPLPVCRFARAYRCARFRGEADFGYDWVSRGTFYGFRVHALVGPEGVIRCVYLTAASEDEKVALEDMVEEKSGRVLGDRHFWSPDVIERLEERGIRLRAPYARKKSDPNPKWSRAMSTLRYRIETVFGQFVDRYELKRVWPRDRWHLVSRLLRDILSHTLAFLLNQQLGNIPSQLALLLNT